MRFIYDTKNMGVSQRSYEALKDALSVGSKKAAVETVLQVNTVDIICGFAVIYCGEDSRGEKEFICYFTYLTEGEVSTDGSGEGSHAYIQAQELLHEWGIEATVINSEYEDITYIIDAIDSFLFNY